MARSWASTKAAYTSFSYDVSRKLKYGAENLLVVKVTCPWIPKGRGFLEYLKGEWTMAAPRHVDASLLSALRSGAVLGWDSRFWQCGVSRWDCFAT